MSLFRKRDLRLPLKARVSELEKDIQNWKNKTIFTGDCLSIMRGLNSDSVDLIYLDPPFSSNRNYSAPIGSEAAGAGFKDVWTLDDVDITWLDLFEAKHSGIHHAILGTPGKNRKAYMCYMGVRFLEMERVLKPSGTLCVHLDSHMSHGIKQLLDNIFGVGKFINEAVWERTSARHNDAKALGRVDDRLFFYGNILNADEVRTPFSKEEIQKYYRYNDDHGSYQPVSLTAKSLSGGGYDYEFHGHYGPWRYPEHSMKVLEEQGLIHFPRKEGGVPRKKLYLSQLKGKLLSTIWTDCSFRKGESRTGYPTQKPLALLERVISLGSKPGDIVLDPFCGCATTLLAAEHLGRQWTGIDIAEKSVELLEKRMKKELGMTFDGIIRKDIPKRTDLQHVPRYNHPGNKNFLYGEQDGRCETCKEKFDKRNLTIDHIIPRVDGGQDTLDNLQLLCLGCQSEKGTRSQAYLIARLERRSKAKYRD